jgi:PIN domain nuclease of toxin-antitoxin system
LGKLHLSIRYEDLFPKAAEENGILVLSPTFEHYKELLKLPFHHRDPFDRLLIAQGLAEGMTLVSCDQHFAAYGVPTIW